MYGSIQSQEYSFPDHFLLPEYTKMLIVVTNMTAWDCRRFFGSSKFSFRKHVGGFCTV